MGQPLRQTSFNAGELDPLVQGRSDLPVFSKGSKTMRNFVPLKGGAAMSRPGSTYVATVKEVEYDEGEEEPERPVRVQGFVFSDTSTVVLELGEHYIRFFMLARAVQSVPGTPYEVTTYTDIDGAVQELPYQAVDLWELRFAQVGNTITITHPRHQPIELKRNAYADWTATETSYTPPAAVLPDVGDSYFTNPFNPGSVPENIITTPFAIREDLLAAEDDDHPAREWVYAFTAIMQHRLSGVILESLATVVKYSTPDDTDTWPIGPRPTLDELTTQKLVVYPDKPVTLMRKADQGAPDPAYRTLGFRIYRGRGDVLGWIGDTRSREFVDTGAEPVWTIQPPLGFNPFKRTLFGGLTLRERPRSISFFQERRVFGGASFRTATGVTTIPGVVVGGDDLGRPGTLFFSATGDYYNFDERLGGAALQVATEALTFELASSTRELVRHLVSLERLIVLTSEGAYTFCGHQGSPLSFDSVNARRTDKVGAGDPTPLVLDNCVLFVRTKGKGARALIPQANDEQPYFGADLSEFAGHLVRGRRRQIVDWCYQEDPFGLIWAVRRDGTLLSLTFDRARQVVGWARHDTEASAVYGAGTYESVCTVPEGEEDAVYAVVKRTVRTPGDGENFTQRYIERFTSRERRVLEGDANPESVEFPQHDDTDSLYPTDVCLDCAVRYRGVPTRSFTGLNVHANKKVWVVARGSPPLYGNVSDDGELEIDEQQLPALPANNAVDEDGNGLWVAHIGLLYECDLESLAVVNDVLKQKTISEVGFELDQAKGVKAGQSFAKLTTWQQRRVADNFGVISAASTLLFTPVPNVWDKTARVCLRQSLPLPVTVVGITREVT